MTDEDLATVVGRITFEQVDSAYRNAKPNPAENPAFANAHRDLGWALREIERLRSREFKALGWMYAELCNRVDAGEDIRRVEVPELIAAYEALQEGE